MLQACSKKENSNPNPLTSRPITPGLRRPILNGKVNFPLTMAPMVGLSHTSFRRLIRHYLPEDAELIWPTEMLNSRRLPRETLGQTPETYRHPSEQQGYLVPQLLGNEDEPLRLSVQKLEEWGVCGIDINMGCPVSKALKHNYGVALMGDPHYAAEVVRMVTRVANVPVSVKLRAVESGNIQELKAFVDGLIAAGASWLTLHPRRGSQKRRGEADWSQIAWLREQIPCALIGNGDIQTSDDIHRMFQETSCDAVMVGRALTARPWLFWQWSEQNGAWNFPRNFQAQKAPQGPEEEAFEYGKALRLLLQFMTEDFSSEALALRKFHFFVKTGSVWLNFGQELCGITHRATSAAALEGELEAFFKQDLLMSERTELRQ